MSSILQIEKGVTVKLVNPSNGNMEGPLTTLFPP